MALQERAGMEPRHCPRPLSPLPAAVCTGLIAALPSGGITKGDEGTVRRIGPPRVQGAAGIPVPCMPAGSRPYKAQGDSGTKGTNPPPSDLPFLEDRD